MSSAVACLPHPDVTDGEKLGADISELSAYIYVATYQLLVMIAEFDRRKYWEGQGFRSCAHWLNHHCGFNMNSARERVRVAHALGRLPKIAKKFSTGQLSYSKVRAVTRAADETNEEQLLTFAEHGTAHQVERLVAQYRRAQHLQNEDNAYRQYLDREVSYYYDIDGAVVMKVRMPAEQGEMVIKALERMMDLDSRGEEPDSVEEKAADQRRGVDEESFLQHRRSRGNVSTSATIRNSRRLVAGRVGVT